MPRLIVQCNIVDENGAIRVTTRESLCQLVEDGFALLLDGIEALDVVHSTSNKLLELAQRQIPRKFPSGRSALPVGASLMEGERRTGAGVTLHSNTTDAFDNIREIMRRGNEVLVLDTKNNDPSDALTFEGRNNQTASNSAWEFGVAAIDCNGKTAAGAAASFNNGCIPAAAILGAGVWADDKVAVCCSGPAGPLLRLNAAHDLAARTRYTSAALDPAASEIVARALAIGGEIAIVAVSSNETTSRSSSQTMRSTWISRRGQAVFGEDQTAS